MWQPRPTSNYSEHLIKPHERTQSVNGFSAAFVVNASITYSFSTRSSSSACSMGMWHTLIEYDHIKASDSNCQSHQRLLLHRHNPVTRSLVFPSWEGYTMTIRE